MDVFVSYSGKDIEFTKKMCAVLKDNGISYWAAHEHNCLGDDSADKTVNYISKAKLVLVFVSKNSNESKHVINELNCATMYKKPILPVVIDDVELSPVFEYYMANANRLSYSQSGDFIEKFVDIVRSMVGIEPILPEEVKPIEQSSLIDKIKERRTLKFALIGVAAVEVIVTVALIIINIIIPASKYNNALELAANGNYDQAIVIFTELGDYKDAIEKISETNYQKADAFAEKGDYANAAICYCKLDNYKDAREKRLEMLNKFAPKEDYIGTIPDVVTLHVSEGLAKQQEFASCMNREGDTNMFLYYASDELIFPEKNSRASLNLVNVSSNKCVLTASIVDKAGNICFQSRGLLPGKMLSDIEISNQPYGKHEMILVVAAYDSNSYELIGVQCSDLIVHIGISN